MLKVSNLSAGYGHIEALNDVSIEAEKGQIVSIIGSNGAGKTTLLRCISSQVKPTAGSIEYLGEPIPTKPHKVVEKVLCMFRRSSDLLRSNCKRQPTCRWLSIERQRAL